jgi:hypothetical protein
LARGNYRNVERARRETVTAAGKKQRELSDDQVARVMALIKDSDSVELKLTVPETDHRSTVMALEMDPLDAQIRQVFFFDTPEPALKRAVRGGARPARAEEGRRLGREATTGCPLHSGGDRRRHTTRVGAGNR